MKPQHAILKQVGDKLFVDVWMEPKPKRAETPGFGYTYNAALESWQNSAQTIEVHPTMTKEFNALSYNTVRHLSQEDRLKLKNSGIEIPCENIEIVPFWSEQENKCVFKAVLNSEKASSESTKQTEIEIIDKFLRAMEHQDYKKWNSYQITTEQLYKKYFTVEDANEYQAKQDGGGI